VARVAGDWLARGPRPGPGQEAHRLAGPAPAAGHAAALLAYHRTAGFLAALTFRRALTEILTARVTDGEWVAADAVRIAGLIAHGNATRIYRLGPVEAPDGPRRGSASAPVGGAA
jgi:hypothetical protein